MEYNKYNREFFLDKILINGKEEFDLVSNSIVSFKFKRQKSFYRVKEEDIQRPDLICIKMYDDVSMMNAWWIIMYINEIHDIWNDMTVGDLLIIPDKQDVNDFVTYNRNS